MKKEKKKLAKAGNIYRRIGGAFEKKWDKWFEEKQEKLAKSDWIRRSYGKIF